MTRPERLELEAHRAQLEADVRGLLDRYLAIAEWDIPDINEPRVIRMIIAAIRQVLDRTEQALPQSPMS